MFKCCIYICLLFSCTDCFNLFPKYAQVITNGNPESYFGFAVQLRSARGDQAARVLVGAPKANSSFNLHSSLFEPGAVYSCLLNNSECKQFMFSPKANTVERLYHHKKDRSWLGIALDGDDFAGGRLVTCAPRWINQKRSRFHLQNGMCYNLDDTTNTERTAKELLPLLTAGNQGYVGKDHVYFYAFGEAGLSVHIPENSTDVLLGSPGILHWKGMVIRYDKHSIEQFLVPNPAEQNAIEYSSYFGYAVSSGKFLPESNEIWYVGGAPRGKTLFGQIFVFQYMLHDTNQILIHYEATGNQLGEYFGSVLTVADVNGDNLDDIIVGAPLHTADDKVDVGCIYVFINNGPKIFNRETILAPVTTNKARFGSAISCLGDINLDGYKDIAVGVPYYDDGKGAVHIYLGSKDGLSRTVSQTILASDISPQLRAFGISLSKGIDIDDNNYNDLAVGAYRSGHVVIIKSRPVVHISLSFTSLTNNIALNTRNLTISACLNYTGKHVPNKMNLKTIVTGDPYYRRIYFSKNHGTVWETIGEHKLNDMSCYHLDVTVENKTAMYLKPIEFQMTYEMLKEDDSFCATCPVVDKTMPNLGTLAVAYQIGCGSDNICEPELKLSARFNHDESSLVIGSKNRLEVHIDIENTAEPAYMCRLQIEIPPEVSFDKISDKCWFRDHDLECDVGNPVIDDGKKKSLTLYLDITKVSVDKIFTVSLNVSSAGEEKNKENNVLTLEMPLRMESTFDISGSSQPDQFSFVGKEEKVLKQDSLMVAHKIQFQNLGPSSTENLEMRFLVPIKFGSSIILNITDTKTISKTQNSNCTIEDSEFQESRVLGNEEILKDLPLNRTLNLACVNNKPDLTCVDIICRSNSVQRSERVIINLNYIVDLKILDEIRGEHDIIVVSTSVNPISEKFITRNSVKFISTVLLGSIKMPSILKWIIIGLVIGIILLCVYIFTLYKCGFFKRKEHENMKTDKDFIIEEDTQNVAENINENDTEKT